MNGHPAHPDRPTIERIEEALLAARHDLVRERADAEHGLDDISAEREIEWEEMAQEEQSADVLTRLSAQQYARLRQIDGALERIDRGEYGTCMSCGQVIDVARLNAQPWTPWCPACAAEREAAPASPSGRASDRPQDHDEDIPDSAPDEEEGGAGSPLAPELSALDDAEVAETIREAFQTEVGEALDTVRVLCRDGVVILAGEVANETLPEIARRIVEDEAGYRVIDRLLVTDVAGGPSFERKRIARAHQLPATAVDDDESDLSEDVLEAEEDGLTFVPPTRPVTER
ncbi:MAG TPA: TraR/DksA C4-type zinc finger protein [Candidatus Limnocylindrales bacterium]|nr:TraR/DksA C4-type zinc finger protein [Candidatus Limnocylindrales bacterium]